MVEDDPQLSDLMAETLEASGMRVTVSTTVADALEVWSARRFDVVLLDIGLPDGSGLDVLGAIRGTGRRTPVLILSALGEEEDIIAGLDQGADGYLTKPVSLVELSARLRALHRRGRDPSRELVRVRAGVPNLSLGHLSFDRVERVLRWENRSVRLTDGEARIVYRLLQQHGEVVFKDELTSAAIKGAAEAGPGLLAVHVSNLRKKLRSAGLPDLVHTERGVGYSLLLTPHRNERALRA